MYSVSKVDDSHIVLNIDGHCFSFCQKEAVRLSSDIIRILSSDFSKTPKKQYKRSENALTQFEIHVLNEERANSVVDTLKSIRINNAEWFYEMYSHSKAYISFSTRSQKMIDKINNIFSLSLGFDITNRENIAHEKSV